MKIAVENLTAEQRDRIISTTEALLPRVLPAGWKMGDAYPNGAWFFSITGLRLMLEVELQDGADLYIHLSVSRHNRVPDYADLKLVKALFIGRDRKAIMVLPAEAEHYNFHPNCLHMWSPLGRDPLPDFRTAEGKL